MPGWYRIGWLYVIAAMLAHGCGSGPNARSRATPRAREAARARETPRAPTMAPPAPDTAATEPLAPDIPRLEVPYYREAEGCYEEVAAIAIIGAAARRLPVLADGGEGFGVRLARVLAEVRRARAAYRKSDPTMAKDPKGSIFSCVANDVVEKMFDLEVEAIRRLPRKQRRGRLTRVARLLARTHLGPAWNDHPRARIRRRIAAARNDRSPTGAQATRVPAMADEPALTACYDKVAGAAHLGPSIHKMDAIASGAGSLDHRLSEMRAERARAIRAWRAAGKTDQREMTVFECATGDLLTGTFAAELKAIRALPPELQVGRLERLLLTLDRVGSGASWYISGGLRDEIEIARLEALLAQPAPPASQRKPGPPASRPNPPR
jgi:hypothetical protein